MKKQKLPDFYGVLEVLHHIQGRIRFKLRYLIGDEEKLEFLKEQLLKLNQIDEVTVNPMLGTVLVKFDEEQLEPVMLMGVILNFLGMEEEVFNQRAGSASSFAKEILNSIDLTIYNKTCGILDLKSVIGLTFLIYGVKKVRQNPIMPNGINLLWWAYNLMSKGGN